MPANFCAELASNDCCLSVEAGIDLKTVSASLGHSAISTTADLYLHLGEQLQREHAARVDAIMGGALSAALRGPHLDKSRESHGEGSEPKMRLKIRNSVVAPTGIEPVYRDPGRSVEHRKSFPVRGLRVFEFRLVPSNPDEFCVIR
jgi:hypothetical protein